MTNAKRAITLTAQDDQGDIFQIEITTDRQMNPVAYIEGSLATPLQITKAEMMACLAIGFWGVRMSVIYPA